MSTNPANAIIDRLIERARDGFDEIGADMEKRLRELVDVPVEGSGSKKIRSKPGEPPRKETGSYQDSFSHATAVEGDRISTKAGTPDPRGEWFTTGTSRGMKPRPHAERVRDEFADSAVDRVKQALSHKQE